MGLELLLLLICPIMMLFMMKGHKHGNHRISKQNTKDNSNNHDSNLKNYKLLQLEGEIDSLRNQNEMLKQKVDDLTKDSTQNHF